MLDAIVASVRALAVPYGYTLAIWSSGALAISSYGVPQRPDVLLFVLGATSGYLIWDVPVLLLTGGPHSFSVSLPGSASLNILAVLPAVLLSLAIRFIPSRRLGFLFSGFLASAAYVASLATLLWSATAFEW